MYETLKFFPFFPEQIIFLVLKTLVIYKDKRKLFKGLGCYYYSPWLKLRISNVHCCYAWGGMNMREREREGERGREREPKKKKREEEGIGGPRSGPLML
jgi:hypothetical protein